MEFWEHDCSGRMIQYYDPQQRTSRQSRSRVSVHGTTRTCWTALVDRRPAPADIYQIDTATLTVYTHCLGHNRSDLDNRRRTGN